MKKTSIPNVLTITRIAILPAIILLIYLDTEISRWTALGLYVFAGVTDFFDGYLARTTGAVSSLGRFLDPVADKLLVITVIIVLIKVNELDGINFIAGIIIVSRELIVTGLREYLAEIRISVPVSILAKWKTAIQILSLGFLIVGDKYTPDYLYSGNVGIVLIWVSAILTILTAYDYFRIGIKHMYDDERE